MTSSRVLLSNADGTARHEPPFVLVFECPGDALVHIVAHLSWFAFVVGALVALFAALGAMPWPIVGFSFLWWGGAIGGRIVVRRRQRQHGTVTIDFDAREVEHKPSGARETVRTFKLDEVVLRLDPPLDDAQEGVAAGDGVDEVGWLLLEPRGASSLRLGRARLPELRKILMIFRQYGVPSPVGVLSPKR